MKIKKCSSCKIYTFKEFCLKCNKKTINPEPPRYSPADVFGHYRRKLIEEVAGKK